MNPFKRRRTGEPVTSNRSHPRFQQQPFLTNLSSSTATPMHTTTAHGI